MSLMFCVLLQKIQLFPKIWPQSTLKEHQLDVTGSMKKLL